MTNPAPLFIELDDGLAARIREMDDTLLGAAAVDADVTARAGRRTDSAVAWKSH